MKNLHTYLLTASSALLLAAPSHALAPPVGDMNGTAVTLTGWLHVDDAFMADVTLEVDVNGEVRPASVSNSGRFTIDLPAEISATLRFAKPGHVTKTVTVDTHHINDGDFTAPRRRQVKLAVIMEQERFMAGLTYAGPVGNLGFEPGGGCVAVHHTRSVTPAKRRTTMEF
jgi:hypothetical protein